MMFLYISLIYQALNIFIRIIYLAKSLQHSFSSFLHPSYSVFPLIVTHTLLSFSFFYSNDGGFTWLLLDQNTPYVQFQSLSVNAHLLSVLTGILLSTFIQMKTAEPPFASSSWGTSFLQLPRLDPASKVTIRSSRMVPGHQNATQHTTTAVSFLLPRALWYTLL